MSRFAAIRREEQKVKKQLTKLQNDLVGLQSAAKALSKTPTRDIIRAKQRVLSAKGRAKIAKAMKERWATHGTLLHEQETALRVAQAQLGHSRMTTTLEVYTHASGDSQRQAVNQVENQLLTIVDRKSVV